MLSPLVSHWLTFSPMMPISTVLINKRSQTYLLSPSSSHQPPLAFGLAAVIPCELGFCRDVPCGQKRHPELPIDFEWLEGLECGLGGWGMIQETPKGVVAPSSI